MWSRWLLTVASLMNSRAAASRLVLPGGDQFEDLELPLAERFLAWRADPAQQPRRHRGASTDSPLAAARTAAEQLLRWARP